jgi:hypothetical protein
MNEVSKPYISLDKATNQMMLMLHLVLPLKLDSSKKPLLDFLNRHQKGLPQRIIISIPDIIGKIDVQGTEINSYLNPFNLKVLMREFLQLKDKLETAFVILPKNKYTVVKIITAIDASQLKITKTQRRVLKKDGSDEMQTEELIKEGVLNEKPVRMIVENEETKRLPVPTTRGPNYVYVVELQKSYHFETDVTFMRDELAAIEKHEEEEGNKLEPKLFEKIKFIDTTPYIQKTTQKFIQVHLTGAILQPGKTFERPVHGKLTRFSKTDEGKTVYHGRDSTETKQPMKLQKIKQYYFSSRNNY